MIPGSESDRDESDPRLKEMRKLVTQMREDQSRLHYNPEEDEKFLAEIRERVQSVATTTPYLEAQDSPAQPAPQAEASSEAAPSNES